jgi:hypothetical protein
MVKGSKQTNKQQEGPWNITIEKWHFKNTGPGFFFLSILSIQCASTTYIYKVCVVDAHFIDKIEENKYLWLKIESDISLCQFCNT